MKVRMKGQVSGTRNGEAWPRPGTVMDLPDDEAATLIRQSMAVEAGDEVEQATPPPADTSAPEQPEQATPPPAEQPELKSGRARK